MSKYQHDNEKVWVFYIYQIAHNNTAELTNMKNDYKEATST